MATPDPKLINWLLTYGGAQRTFAAWGLEGLHFNFVSQGMDTVTFSAPGVPFDDEPLFAYGSPIAIHFRSAEGTLTQWFVGTIVKPRARGGSRAEFQEFQAVGPWFQLQEMVFQQVWTWFLSNNPAQFQTSTSHLVLNGTSDGLSLVRTGTVIRAVLQYVINNLPAAPFQIGAIMAGLFPPVDEIRDRSCAEVIKLELRWHPDAVTWFDYSTTPPTFHCDLYGALPAVTLSIPPVASDDDAIVDEVELESREDLQRPSVAIKYEVRTTVDGEERLSLVPDVWPANATGRELSALVATIDSQGGRVTNLSAEIVTQAIPADLTAAAALDWWKAKFPELLGDDRLVGTNIVTTGRVLVNDDGSKTVLGPAEGLPNELVGGQIANWMPGTAQREEVSVQVTYSLYDISPTTDPTAKPRVTLSDPRILTRAITTTDLAGGTYRGPKRIDERADPLPIGLAKYLYDALQILHQSGSFKLVESEASGTVGLGMVVNLAGGKASWATMRALVQTIAVDADNGETTVTVGPAEHLGVTDLVELLRVNRTRNRSGQPGAQGSGEISTGADAALGKQTANADRAGGASLLSLQVIKSGDRLITLDGPGGTATFVSGAGGTRKIVTVNFLTGVVTISDLAHPGRGITLDISACVGAAVDRGLTIREMPVCQTEQVNGVATRVTRHVLGLFSDVY